MFLEKIGFGCSEYADKFENVGNILNVTRVRLIRNIWRKRKFHPMLEGIIQRNRLFLYHIEYSNGVKLGYRLYLKDKKIIYSISIFKILPE